MVFDHDAMAHNLAQLTEVLPSPPDPPPAGVWVDRVLTEHEELFT